MKTSSLTVIFLLVVSISVFFTSSWSQATPTKPTPQQVKDWPLYLLVTEDPNNLDDTTSWKVLNTTLNREHPTSNQVVLAKSHFQDSLFYETGWYFLTINTSTTFFRDKQQSSSAEADQSNQFLAKEYFANGFMDGYLSQSSIESYQDGPNAWQNNAGTASGVPQNVSDWMYDHVDFMRQQVRLNNKTDPWWRMVGNLFQQLEGIAAGYTRRAKELGKPESNNMTFLDAFAVNWAEGNGVDLHFLGPSHDESYMQNNVQEFLSNVRSRREKEKQRRRKGNNNKSRNPQQQEHGDDYSSFSSSSIKSLYPNPKSIRYPGSTHCSALIRMSSNDLYSSQAAWQAIFMLTKFSKTYQFSNSRWVTMSSWPGTISSLDDFYSCNTFTSLETSLSVYNYSLYKSFPPQVVSEFIRVMVANYVANSGPEWRDAFARLNSGTYNNLYLVTDYSLVHKEHLQQQQLPPNTVWLIEQIPHHVISGDVTSYVNQWGFFPGFNSPFFNETRRIAGWDQKVAEYGDGFFSFYNYSRFKIFHRDAPKIQDIAGMQRIMRYNDYQHDPASLITNCSGTLPIDGKCDPPYSSTLAIACRGDLMKGGLTQAQLGPLWQDLGQGMTSETDAKISRWSTYKSKETLIIAGPAESIEHDIPAFNFLTSPWYPMIGPEPGLPNIINNSWQLLNFSGVGEDDEGGTNGGDDSSNQDGQKGLDEGIEIAFIILAVVAGVLVVAYFLEAKMREHDKVTDRSGLLDNHLSDEQDPVFGGSSVGGRDSGRVF